MLRTTSIGGAAHSDWPMAGSQASLGPKLAYRIETREDRLADAVARVVGRVGGLRERIDREVARLRRA